MLFRGVNLKEELEREREGPAAQPGLLLAEAREILDKSLQNDHEIMERLKKGRGRDTVIEPVMLPEQEQGNIFHVSHIRNICVRYRLRFLDTKFFKGDYPYEALRKIAGLERKYNIKIQQFKVVAPTRLFNLIDPDKDPLLFANLGNDRYYLLHKWGNDMPWYRKILAWPLRNINTLFITLISFALLVSLSVPKELLVLSSEFYDQIYVFRILFLLQLVIGGFFVLVYIGLVRNKWLSESEWNNKYLR
ncbi:MAG: hypothetical protein AB1458_01770 [Bacteroidota bacterium]